MANLTIVSETWARPGGTYHVGVACEVAADCPVSKLCQNQQPGRRYRVVKVRPAHHSVCSVFEGGARVVEVEPMPVVASMPAARLKGTMAVWEAPVCTKRWCPNWDTCFNPAMETGRKYAVASEPVRMDCPMGHDLRRVTVEPAP